MQKLKGHQSYLYCCFAEATLLHMELAQTCILWQAWPDLDGNKVCA